MTIPTNYFTTSFSVTTPSDLAKAFMLDPKNTSGLLLAEVATTPYSTDLNMKALFYYTAADPILVTVRDLSATDAFGASSILSSYATLQTNVCAKTKNYIKVLVNNSTNIYTLNNTVTTKYDPYITVAASLLTDLQGLKTQATTLLNSINSVKAALPVNQPTSASYTAVTNAYTNLAASLTFLSACLDSAINFHAYINSSVTNMKDLTQALIDGDCDETYYTTNIGDYCHLFCLYGYYLYRVLYNFAKNNPTLM